MAASGAPKLGVMFMRVRWFLFGVVATMGATAYLFARVRRMRERMSPQSVAKVAAVASADVMEFVGRRLAASGGRHQAAG